MTTLYHIHVSCLHADPSEEHSRQEGYWALVSTNNINEIIKVENEMNNCLKNDTKDTKYANDFQTIVSIVKLNDSQSNYITLQQLYRSSPGITSNNLYYNKSDVKIARQFLYHDTVYRNDLAIQHKKKISVRDMIRKIKIW